MPSDVRKVSDLPARGFLPRGHAPKTPMSLGDVWWGKAAPCSYEVALKKPETIFACQNCGHQSRKWQGKCPECGEWNSLVEERERATRKGAGRNSFKLRDVVDVAYSEIESQDETRIPSGVTEFDRVLGGGIVPGTLVLIGGDPGIG